MTTSSETLDLDETSDNTVPLATSVEGAERGQAPGHQGVESGGKDMNLRVLYCSNVNLSVDYECVYALMKQFGIVERIKLKLAEDKQSFYCYVKFVSCWDAKRANESLNGHKLNDSIIKTKIFNVQNLNDDLYDFIPNKEERPDPCNRLFPTPVWHVANYKEGYANIIKAAECIENKVGSIPKGNLKKYGKNILIKAGNETQAALLCKFKPPAAGNVKSISPHRFFNTLKGVVYSKDLYDFEEEEILSRCPTCVCQVRKLGGGAAILMTFSSNYLPDSISVGHERIKVRKFKRSPKQCRNCFEYGHIQAYCSNKKRCSVCSAEHEVDGCSSAQYCFLCEGNHSPISRVCSRYRLEQEILMTADNEHISIGAAKRLVMGANKNTDSSYASALKVMKNTKDASQPNTASGRRNPPHPQNPKTPKSSNVQEANEGQNVCPEKPSSQSEMPTTSDIDVESLPDLSEPLSTECPSRKSSKSSPDINKPPQKGRTISVNLKSSVVTVTKKTKDDDFTVPVTKKRARVTSPPKNRIGVSTSNVFSPLEDDSLPKKIVSKDETKMEFKNKGQSCIPKIPKLSNVQLGSKNSASEKQACRSGTVNPSLDEKGSKKLPVLKEKFRDNTSPSSNRK